MGSSEGLKNSNVAEVTLTRPAAERTRDRVADLIVLLLDI
jgi:hypothetical protein